MTLFSPKLKDIFSAMNSYAHKHRFEYAGIEMLAMHTLKDEDVIRFVTEHRIRPLVLESTLDRYLRETSPRIDANKSYFAPKLTLDLRQLWRCAFELYTLQGGVRIKAIDLFVMTVWFEHSLTALAFNYIKCDFSHFELPNRVQINGVLSRLSATYENQISEPLKTTNIAMDSVENTRRKEDHVEDEPATAFTHKLVGRSHQLMAMWRILARKEKNNLLVVGERGVGKSFLIQYMMSTGSVEPNDSNDERYIWHVYDTEQLWRACDSDEPYDRKLKLEPKSNKLQVVAIDNLGEFITTGVYTSQQDEGVRLVLQLLNKSWLRVVGACTLKEFQLIKESQPALLRYFQRVDLPEVDEEECFRILQDQRAAYEKYHGVNFSDEALQAIMTSAKRYDLGNYFPDKAVDLMDEVGAYVSLNPRGRASEASIAVEVVETIARQRARLTQFKEIHHNPIVGLRERLSEQIFNQDHAIETLVNSLNITFSDLHDQNRTRGCFLLVGPTGVGKTELCRQLALSLRMPLTRYDMSEFSERHTCARLIGAPPGYVGFEGGGQLLTNAQQSPNSIILLDELEKAHLDVINLLLQIMDYGTVSSAAGERARFNHSIIMATTNSGASYIARGRPGFVENSAQSEYKQQLKRCFSPELINRFDAVVYFNALSHSSLIRMVEKLMLEFNRSLRVKNLSLDYDDRVAEYLAKRSYDEKMGARPLKRFFEKSVKLPVVEYLHLHQDVEGVALLRLDADELRFTWPGGGGKKAAAGSRRGMGMSSGQSS